MKVDWKILKANADTERAQLNRILEDIKASIKNEAQATLQAANIQATLLSEEGASGMASAWRETFAKVTQLEGGVNALSQDVTALEVSVYDPTTGLAATSSAVQSMSTEIDTLSGLVMSAYTLALDSNGYVVGWKFTNDGTTGIVDFRADRFRISAPGSIKSVEFADGLLKSVNATHNLYMGAGFGVDDSMVMWYGSTAVPSAASSSNGLFWIKNDGTAYFGGGLSNSVVANLPVIAGQIALTSSLQYSITQIDGEVSLLGTALTDVQGELAGKASVGAVSVLEGQISVVDGKANSNSAAITQVSAKTFSASHGWQFIGNAAGFTVSGGSLEQWPTTNNNGAVVVVATTGDPNFISPAIKVEGRLSPVVRALVRSRGAPATWERVLYWATEGHGFSGAYYLQAPAPTDLGGGWLLLEWDLSDNADWRGSYITRLRFDFVASSGTSVDVQWIAIGSKDPSNSASVIQSFTSSAGPGGTYAQALLMTDVNGRIAGTRLTNTGTESIFSVLADTAEFVSADGSFTITGGRVITRSGGFLDVKGKPFGLGGDLVEWYGADVGNLNNCSRSNAIFFKTNTGIFYAKGMIFAGTITAGGQTLALNATSYTTGTFGTNGGPIQINASFAHSKRQNAGQIGTTKNTIAKGAGTNGGSIELWRRIGGGGWGFVSGTTFGGTLNVVNYPDPEIAGYAQWSLGGSITYTDNVGGTAAREYEVRLTSLTMQDVTITGTAPIPAATEGRNIGVLTAEG